MRKSKAQLLADTNSNNTRALAVEVYRRLLGRESDGQGSLFATAFHHQEDATQVYSDIVTQVERIEPVVDELVLLPPLDVSCVEDGIVKIEELLFLVLSKKSQTVVPVCSIVQSSTELLDTIIHLFSVSSKIPIHMKNVIEIVLKDL
jgi:hypothetical protein